MTDYEKFKKFFDEMGIKYVEEEYDGMKDLWINANYFRATDDGYVTFDENNKFKYFEVY